MSLYVSRHFTLVGMMMRVEAETVLSLHADVLNVKEHESSQLSGDLSYLLGI